MIITITGPPGSGKSTIARLLCEKLNLKHYSVVDFRRKIAEKRGITLEELNKEDEKTGETDRLADEWQKKLGKTENNFVIDGRLPAYFIPNSVKIFLKVDPKVGAERVIKYRNGSAVEKYKNIEDAVVKMHQREESDKKRYRNLYGVEYDKLDFDLIIDTTNDNPESIVKKILEFAKKPQTF